MQIDRRSFLLMTAATAACSRLDQREVNMPTSLQRAGEFLWAQQAEDGGFHSSTYGLLRSGQSLTPFILDALLALPDRVLVAPPAAVKRALSFIKKNTNSDGTLGRMDETAADYPNYATALAVTAILKARPKNEDLVEALVEPMIAQLRTQQFSETHGWNPDDAPYGGWGMGGPIHRPPDAGHVDLSMTRCVMQAFRAAGVSASDPVMARALIYLKRSQNADGGFYFSTVNPEINKAGETNGQFVSYGTATADGVLALRAAGIPDTDDRIAMALKWLKNHHQLDHAPGFEGTARETWGLGLRFYYAYVISRALPELPVQLPPQAADNSFRNSNKLVKEDDPLIATTFAVHVLNRHLPGV